MVDPTGRRSECRGDPMPDRLELRGPLGIRRDHLRGIGAAPPEQHHRAVGLSGTQHRDSGRDLLVAGQLHGAVYGATRSPYWSGRRSR